MKEVQPSLPPEKSYEKRLNFVVTALYIILFAATFYFVVQYALPMFLPFIIAFIIAAILQKPLNFLTKKTKIGKGLWAAVCVFALIGILIFLLYLVFARIYEQLQGLIDYFIEQLSDLPSFIKEIESNVLEFITVLPDKMEDGARLSVGEFFDGLITRAEGSEDGGFNIQEILNNMPEIGWITSSIEGVWGAASRLPIMIVGIMVTLIATIFTTSDWDRIIGFLKRQLPEEKLQALEVAKGTIGGTAGKLVRSYLIIIGITFVEMLLSLLLASAFGVYDSGYILGIAVIIAIVDILPVLGTGSVVVPWALISFATGKTGMGIWLLVTFLIISVVRQYIEPKLVSNNLGLPPVLTLIGMYVGLQLFGVIGMLIVPLTLMLVKVLNDRGILKLWKSQTMSEDTEIQKTK
ncbi:MAG: sporulation integral membrane protein YtvI [Oscillospiraceae bacterium]|nr:sporulation integral membrane protein YtvI [Oscillospiraceae bacterium]